MGRSIGRDRGWNLEWTTVADLKDLQSPIAKLRGGLGFTIEPLRIHVPLQWGGTWKGSPVAKDRECGS
jgi:hypothetical protein